MKALEIEFVNGSLHINKRPASAWVEDVERLQAENFKLAAGQCVSASADEGGRPFCKEASGWRELALIQAGDAGVLQRMVKAETELSLMQEAFRDEISENLRLREFGGALPDENITAHD